MSQGSTQPATHLGALCSKCSGKFRTGNLLFCRGEEPESFQFRKPSIEKTKAAYSVLQNQSKIPSVPALCAAGSSL